jgi:hypothetical protein
MVSIRGRRSHSHVRRLMTPPTKACLPAVALESAATPEADADQLIASFRARAYSEARRRQRQAQASDVAEHWGDVARLIARRTGERRDAQPPSRTERDVELAGGREDLPTPRPVRFFEVDPLDELERLLAVKPQRFRLQFFGVGADLGPAVLTETEIHAPDASSAIRAAAEATWPARAVGLRVLDLEGREIFERLRADLR